MLDVAVYTSCSSVGPTLENLRDTCLKASLNQCFPTLFHLLPKIAPQRWVVTPITHEQQWFSQKLSFILVECQIKREHVTSYNR